jgi:hypothetical protein
MMIPVRVPAEARPVLVEGFDPEEIGPDHPLYDWPCPVCDHPLGEQPVVLILAGIEPADRKDTGFVTGAGIPVHEECAK